MSPTPPSNPDRSGSDNGNELQRFVLALVERVYRQSELLTRRAEKVTQQEFEELDAHIVHLIVDGSEPTRAYCTGNVIDTQRWVDSPKPRKQCQHCLAKFLSEQRDKES